MTHWNCVPVTRKTPVLLTQRNYKGI